MERIEILTGEQRRRRYTPQEKAKFVAMTLQPGLTKIALSKRSDQSTIEPAAKIKLKSNRP
jgi:transposase